MDVDIDTIYEWIRDIMPLTSKYLIVYLLGT